MDKLVGSACTRTGAVPVSCRCMPTPLVQCVVPVRIFSRGSLLSQQNTAGLVFDMLDGAFVGEEIWRSASAVSNSCMTLMLEQCPNLFRLIITHELPVANSHW